MKLVQKHEVVTYPEYQAVLDEFDDNGTPRLLMHIEVEPSLFNARVFARLINEWVALRECIDAPIFALEPEPDDDKWERFVSRLGFSYASTRVDCTDGQSRRLFVSNKKKNEQQEHNGDQSD